MAALEKFPGLAAQTGRFFFGPSPGARVRASLKRWVRIVWLALAGFAVSSITAPLVLAWVKGKLPTFGWWVGPPIAVLAVAIALPFARGRVVGWVGARSLVFYPPTWLSGALGFAGVVALWLTFPEALQAIVGIEIDSPALLDWVQLIIPTALALGASGVAVLGAGSRVVGPLIERRRLRRQLPSHNIDGESVNLLESFSAQCEWLKDDTEISVPSMDAFQHGHWRVAQRIAFRLAGSSDGSTGPTVALVGPLGSGKSSILNLVQYDLAEKRLLGSRITIVPVSLWPFDSAEAAVGGVLRSLSQELGHYANVGDLAGLPDRYVRVIEKAGGFWEAASSFFRPPKDPLKLLQKYQEVTVALGLHVVLWIEDFERFAGTEGLEDEDTAKQREADRLSAIRALLHMLDRLGNVSVVVASTSLHVRFDLDKIARFVERPPKLRPNVVAPILRSFRRGALGMLGSAIDPVNRDEAENLFLGTPMHRIFAAEEPLKAEDRWSAMALLAVTPRRLKQGLRLCLETWERLVGEIDFDDVLAMSILRASEPDVFALIEDHVPRLQHGPVRDDGDKESAFEIALNELVPKSEGRRRSSIDALIDWVFPHRYARPDTHDLPDRPQGLGVDRHVDYWERFLTAPSLSSGERDQPVLRAILDWEKQEGSTLSKLMADEGRSSTVETFGKMLSWGGLVRLFEEISKQRGVEDPSKWPLDQEWRESKPPGLVSVWRLTLRRDGDESVLRDAVLRVIERTTKTNLSLANYVVRYFATKERQVTGPLSDKSVVVVQSRFRELIADFAQGTPEKLLSAIAGGPPYLLLQSCWGLERIRGNKTDDVPFEGWSEFAKLMLDAAEKSPAQLIPQLIPFFVNQEERFRPDDEATRAAWTFDRERAGRLFVQERLFQVLRDNPLDAEQLHEAVKAPYIEVLVLVRHATDESVEDVAEDEPDPET